MAKKIKKVLAMCMAISMVMSLLTISVGAAGSVTTCGYHQHDSVACYGMDYENPVCGKTEETVDTVCPITAHGEACYHQHDESCNGYICGLTPCTTEEHTHDDSCHFHSSECACQLDACTATEHIHEDCHLEHNEGCYGQICSGPCTEDHVHDGCHECSDSCIGLTCTTPLCTKEEHTHGPDCHLHSDECACQLVQCTTVEHTHDESCHFHKDDCNGLICGMEAGQLICTDTNHDNEHVHSEELGCFALHTHVRNAKNEDGCYAETLTCKATKAHTHTSACTPSDVNLGDEALISKDKYASWHDDAEEVADVTLKIGGKQTSNVDVVIVMGGNMTTYKKIVAEMIDMFKPLLEDEDTNTNIKLGMVAMEKSRFDALELTELSNVETDENYYENVIKQACDDIASFPVGPTNLEGTLREAYAMLKADTDVAAEDKYVFVMSTGRTYWFNDTDDETGEPVTVVNKSGNDFKWGYYQWQSNRGRHTSLYMIPDTYKNSYDKYFEDIEKWVQADGDKYVYRMPEGMTFGEWNALNTNSRNPVNPAPTEANFVTGVKAGLPLADPAYTTQHAMGYERGQYEAVKAYAALQAEGYHCYAICSETPNYQNNSEYYYAVRDAAYGAVDNTQIQVGHAFMDYLARMSGQEYAPLTWDYERNEDGTFKSAQPVLQDGFFAPIKARIIDVLSAGSSVEDFIGYSSNATTGYDFDFMVDGTITLKVGDTAYTTVKLDTPNAGATASYTFTAPGATEPTFSLDYFVGNGTTTEKFIWYIDETVTVTAPASLTYQVKLPAEKKQTAPGTYTVETNQKAVLTPVDSDGHSSGNELFPVPELDYTVQGGTGETPPSGGGGNLPEGNLPSRDEEVVDIGEGDIPLTSMPDEDVPLADLPEDDLEDLLDEEVPLAMAPATGDVSAIWMAMSALSGAGLFLTRKKRDEE